MVSAESFGDAQPPARIPQLPAELALGLGVRGTPRLGHHDRSCLTGRQAPQPAWDAPDREGGPRRGVWEGEVRRDAPTAAGDRKPPLADRPGHLRIRVEADRG